MIIAGIDIGISGALAFLDGMELKAVHDMPVGKTAGGKSVVISSQLRRIFDEVRPDMTYIENVHAMPKQGVSSVFSFGRSLGNIEGALGVLGIPFTYVEPTVWKRRYGLIGSEKDAARTTAARLFPIAPLARKKDIGRADAILIANWGRLYGSHGNELLPRRD